MELRRPPWEIALVPEKPPLCFDTSPSTVAVLAAAVDPKSTNSLVRQLSQVAPMENLRHVKRVRRSSIGGKNELHLILCSLSKDEDFMETVSADVLKLIEVHGLSPFLAKVAKFAASSREEWEDQCKLWPTSYHPPCNIDGISGFSEEDSRVICNFMKTAIKLAKVDHFSKQVANVALIVDPSNGQIIASATDEIFPTSRKKCGTENGEITYPPASEATGSGELSHCCSSEDVRSYTDVGCLHPWKWTEQKFPPHETSECPSCWHPLRHAALVAIENAAARDRQLFPDPGCKNEPVSMDKMPTFSSNSPSKRQKTSLEDDGELILQAARPYLCTGFDVYLVWEPCTMCAMALVHQRLRRIFFAFPNPNTGALGSVHRLHGEKSLNHHYSVFRVMVPTDASRWDGAAHTYLILHTPPLACAI